MGKCLHRGNNELFAVYEILLELLSFGNARAFLDRADDAADLSKAPDCFADLFVQDSAVRDDDDRIEDRLTALRQADQRVREPCN